MDLARAYYATGSFDLAEAAFLKLRESNLRPPAMIAINRYLDTIQTRKRQTQAGWSAFGELGLGYDSNITRAAELRSGPRPRRSTSSASRPRATRSSDPPPSRRCDRRGVLLPALPRLEPLRGGSCAGVSTIARATSTSPRASARGGALNAATTSTASARSSRRFYQKGAAPGDPRPTNDRRMAGGERDWRHALSTRTQLGLACR